MKWPGWKRLSPVESYSKEKRTKRKQNYVLDETGYSGERRSIPTVPFTVLSN